MPIGDGIECMEYIFGKPCIIVKGLKLLKLTITRYHSIILKTLERKKIYIKN